MTVHIGDLTTDISVDAADNPTAAESASPWEAAAAHRMDQRRQCAVRMRTRSEGFDD